ncbi:MAG: hypothetical protein ACRCZY_12295 [Phocaeicola sp.]
MKAPRRLIQISSWIAVLTLLCTACNDDLAFLQMERNKEDVIIQIPLSIPGADKIISSRAPDNNIINDLYVLIFDANGEVKGRKFFTRSELTNGVIGSQPNSESSENWVKMATKKGISYIYGFSNLGGTIDLYVGSLKNELDAITNRNELLNLSLTLTEDISRVGSSYLMSGKLEEYNISSSTIRTLPLRRIDSSIKFKIETGGNCKSFTLKSYQLFNVPKKSYLIERSAKREIGATPTWEAANQVSDFFNTPEITGRLNATEGFMFYLTENRLNGEKEITGVTEKEIYSKREKQLKNPIESGHVENGAYEYAPNYGSYIVLKGYFRGNSTVENNSGSVEASVQYTIHLGYAEGATLKEKANDFFTNRNTQYTYQIKVMGINDIIIEVINETENSPGAEGDVIFTNGTTRINLDSHYETVLLKFSKDLLTNDGEEEEQTDFFNYQITTPFTEMGDDITDESWIRIVRNPKISNGVYSTDLGNYPTNNYLTIEGLINELKAHATTPNFFDSNNEVIYTCHIDEFYYNAAPANTPPLSGNLWRYFTNVPNRELHILTDVELSPDKQSSITRSTYILSQRAIQTFFDTTTTDIYSAYGVECINETGAIRGWEDYRNRIGLYTNQNENNGSSNFKSIINQLKSKTTTNGNHWATYVNWAMNGYKVASIEAGVINAMKTVGNTDYKRAYLACLQRNRDLNGNGVIDDNEIKWYLPALNQYVGMFIGDAGISEEAKLYTENKYLYKHFLSSTVSIGNSNNPANLWIYWAEESVSISWNTEYGMSTYSGSAILNHYRCMRNLGNGTPLFFYTEEGGSVTTPYLNQKSYRSSLSFGELGRHNNWEDVSRISANGFMINKANNRPSSNVGAAMQYNIADSPNSGCYNLEPKGKWRAPNLREFYLLKAINILQSGDVARTIFKFHNEFIPALNGGSGTGSSKRIGWNFNGNDINMGNGSVLEGGYIRCVRDN